MLCKKERRALFNKNKPKEVLYDTEEENRKMLKDFREDINKRDLSNSESFDKALLSLSSAGLALSLTFIKFIVPLKEITYIYFLYLVWIFFGLTILLVISSILVSQKALRNSLKNAEKYYLEDDEDSFNKEDKYSVTMRYLPFIQALTFTLAIIFIIVFTILNFNKSKELKVIEKNIDINNLKVAHEGTTTPLMQMKKIQDGTSIPSMQIKNNIVNKGANTPSMQKTSSPDKKEIEKKIITPSKPKESK